MPAPGQQASPDQLRRMRAVAREHDEIKSLYETLTEEPPKDMPPPRSRISLEKRVRELEIETDRIYEESEQA